ncbi:DNA-binding transcriptional ArsR family regulator [Kitasatospora sp. MAP12-15]|nr:DNA-binding transcriptional ArsR family regulator [Kitasatospora sp. MAP12-44]
MARNGLAEVLSGLHPTITWDNGCLDLMIGLQGRVSGSTSLVLSPSPFGHRPRFVIDSMPAPVHRQPMLTYPALAWSDRPALPSDARANHELIGATRARLLADLHDSPRTTGELGERHRLSIGTVSYHLGILHRAGLLTRTRVGRSVRYEQTPHAAVLLDVDRRGSSN